MRILFYNKRILYFINKKSLEIILLNDFFIFNLFRFSTISMDSK